MHVVLIWFGFVSLVAAEERGRARYDSAALSEIAQDVLRRAALGPTPSAPEPTLPIAASPADLAVIESPPNPDPPVTHIDPAREGITVAIPPGSASPKKAPKAVAISYQSNSWRQRTNTARALSFSSGVLAPASGLDPALKTHADGLRAEGRDFVYGFLLLRVPPDEALERKLVTLGVELLGPHDDHHKARLPVGTLETIAALPEVEWLGVSAPEQKLSAELAALRGSRTKGAAVDPATPLPIVVNLFEGDENGEFRRRLEAAGAAIGQYDAGLHFYRAVATEAAIDRIAALDFVLFVEPIGLGSVHHDQSTPLIDADMIRPGTPLGLTRFSAASIPVGIMDSGFMMGAGGHDDLWFKTGCGYNFTTDAAGPFNDEKGHGTHVLGTIAGTGSADSRYRGVAPGVGLIGGGGIRAAKIFKRIGKSPMAWFEDAMDWLALAGECSMPAPLLINLSGGESGTGFTGTDSTSRKLDEKVWINRQMYIVSAGNDGPDMQTIGKPAVAKNALTVGNVFDNSYPFVGEVTQSSSRGPTGDGRIKPNVMAPGHTVTSLLAGTTSAYTPDTGTSMAAPHVTGLAATLMEHYPSFQLNPALLRAHMMATAIAHDDLTGMSNHWGLGRVSGYVAHWDHPNSDGWSTYRYWGGVNSQGFQYGDITVPPGTRRLIAVLTWDEPPASSGASRAVMYDVDLWLDHDADCGFAGACGEYASVSSVDNVEYIAIDNPPPGAYRMKAFPSIAPNFYLPYGMVAMVLRGDPTPHMSAYLSGPSNPTVGSTFGVTVNVSTPAYVASGVEVELTSLPLGVTPLLVQTTRLDGVAMTFSDPLSGLTLGNIVPTHSRSATWYLKADSTGPKDFSFRAWSENGGEVIATRTVQVETVKPDLLVTTITTKPTAPSLTPGTSFSVTDTVQNVGMAPSKPSATRYYLSLDAAMSADDTRLTGSHSVPGLDIGASHSATATVNIPAATPLNSYYLLVCADTQNAVEESNESNNCTASSAPIVTVARADLVEREVSAPPATKARGTSFQVTDTVQNLGAVAAKSSTTRYYLSLDAVKGAGDLLLTGSRSVPGVAAGGAHSGTVKVTIPTSTAPNTYFLLACTDNGNTVVETDETNNCRPSSSTMTVTP